MCRCKNFRKLVNILTLNLNAKVTSVGAAGLTDDEQNLNLKLELEAVVDLI